MPDNKKQNNSKPSTQFQKIEKKALSPILPQSTPRVRNDTVSSIVETGKGQGKK